MGEKQGTQLSPSPPPRIATHYPPRTGEATVHAWQSKKVSIGKRGKPIDGGQPATPPKHAVGCLASRTRRKSYLCNSGEGDTVCDWTIPRPEKRLAHGKLFLQFGRAATLWLFINHVLNILHGISSFRSFVGGVSTHTPNQRMFVNVLW